MLLCFILNRYQVVDCGTQKMYRGNEKIENHDRRHVEIHRGSQGERSGTLQFLFGPEKTSRGMHRQFCISYSTDKISLHFTLFGQELRYTIDRLEKENNQKKEIIKQVYIGT